MTMILDDRKINVRIYGYCEFSDGQVEDIIQAGRAETLTDLRGEFTIVYTYKHNTNVGIITSKIGAIQYYYYHDGKIFLHGQNVIDIFRQLHSAWEWDWESVGDLCELENLTESRTLHKNIDRVPPGSTLKFSNGIILRRKSLLDEITVAQSDPVDAIDVFNSETKRWASTYPYLSLSGGFDSRVILSSMLKQDIYPGLVTLGTKESSDIRVATQIAEKFGLNHIKVTLSVNDLLDNGEHIAFITNGTKPACHWHTYLYPRKAGVPAEQSFYVGTLGEFARSYYFDKGFIGLLAEGVASYAQERFWSMKLSRHRTFRETELNHLCDPLREQICQVGVNARAKRNAKLSHGEFLAGGTRYYLEQRVPNFYANGIRMYNDTAQWRSPFHNVEWLNIVWNLSDNWKLGSNWHRLAIQRNFPDLLGFPEEKGFNKQKMLAKAPPLYWLPVMQRVKYNSYDLSQSWYANEPIRSLILDNHFYLDEIVERNLSESILEEHRVHQNRTKTISFFLTILYFKMAMNKRH